MPEILIAGGGLAGSALAILLGRNGFTVEVFERGRFPREKPCGEGMMPAGVAALERLGLSDAAGGFPFQGVRYHFGKQTIIGRFPATAGIPATGFGQRRKYLDQLLFDAAARTKGVTARAGAQVDAPLVENGQVVGLIVDGEPRRARMVVAADGLHSPIRKALGLDVPQQRKRFGVRVHYRLAETMENPAWVDVYTGRGHELYVTPLPGREVLVAALTDAGSLESPVERAFARWLQAEPALAARLNGAEQLTELLGASPLAGRARCGVAPGVVLLGDAAGFVDPITGGGMTQALLSAELLADFITRHRDSADDWIWEFERRRRAMLHDYEVLTQAVLWLARHPRLVERSLSALRGSPGLLSHLVGVSGGVRSLFGGFDCWAAPAAPSGARVE